MERAVYDWPVHSAGQSQCLAVYSRCKALHMANGYDAQLLYDYRIQTCPHAFRDKPSRVIVQIWHHLPCLWYWEEQGEVGNWTNST